MKHFLYILILISLGSCSGVNRPKKPKNLIAKETMSEIMYDLYILNAAKGVNRKLLENHGIMPMEYVYEKYGIDSLQFAESNTFYAYDTEMYSGIVEKAKTKLETNKEYYEDLTNIDRKSKDSLTVIEKRKKDTTDLELEEY